NPVIKRYCCCTRTNFADLEESLGLFANVQSFAVQTVLFCVAYFAAARLGLVNAGSSVPLWPTAAHNFRLAENPL
ncbi:MAG TPA: hypothetical protein VIV66_11030, partial [Pyrinomonadaceae bacterium]